MTPTEFKTIRKRLGLTQAALAERIGVTNQQVRRYEAPANATMSRPISAQLTILMRLLERETQ